MTTFSDTIQLALSQSGLLGYGMCAILVLLARQVLRLVWVSLGDTLRLLRRYAVPVWRLKFWAWTAFAALPLWMCSDSIVDGLQWAEYQWRPVYVGQADGVPDERTMAAVERQLARHCDTYEMQVVKRRTEEIAAKINSRPLAIYETALLECGLNPFRVRDDKVAAGWIQFTRAGLSGLGVSLEQVIDACQRRDIEKIMDLTEKYLVRRWENKGRPAMRNTIDLYLAVFAPAHISAAPEQVVYQGFGNPAYDKNAGLDGWYTDASGNIIRSRSMCDGKITVGEIYFCLERRKAALLGQ